MAEDSGIESDEESMQCAGCGVKEGDDDIKLMKCTACYLVRYCSVKCQRGHWPKHKKKCKRAAELRDEILFKQPESSHLGDCPICSLPLPSEDFSLYSCCAQTICGGCAYASQMREIERRLQQTCPFCRHPTPNTQEEAKNNYMKRVEANDPVAMNQLGSYYDQKGDNKKAFQYYTKAAGLGNMNAHYNLSVMYEYGDGVEKDKKKELFHLEEAAIGGHASARYNLGCEEAKNGRLDRAVKHFIIAANMGQDESLESLKRMYREGIVSKEKFATALRAHKAAVDATKSPQREVAAAFYSQQISRAHGN